MRTILILCGATLIGGGFLIWRATRPQLAFGEFVGAPKAEVSDLIERPAKYMNTTVAVEGEVRRQCQAMGCYFFFETGGKELRIDLESIAMNAPATEGRNARVEGQVVTYRDGYQLYASAVEFR